MAGKRSAGRPFTSGDSRRNNSGRPKLPAELIAVRMFDNQEIKRIIFKYLDKTPEELGELSQNANQTKAIDLIIIRFISDALKGDHYKAEWLMQRSIGRVTEQTEEKEEGTAHSKLIGYLKTRIEQENQT